MRSWSNGRVAALVCFLALFGAAHAAGYSQPTFDRPHALLAQGKIGQSKWQVYAHLSREANAARRPCIDVSIGTISGAPEEALRNSICGEVSPLPAAVGASIDPGPKQTAIALAFSKQVKVARVVIAGRGASLIRTKVLSHAKAQRTHLQKFSFAVLVKSGSFCIRQIQGLAGNKVVSDSGPTSCEG